MEIAVVNYRIALQATTSVVILSGAQSAESKDLRTDFRTVHNEMRRSFDSLRSLRMTASLYVDTPGNYN